MINYYLTLICNEIHHQSILRYISDYNNHNDIKFVVNQFIYSGIIELKHTSYYSDSEIYTAIDIFIPGLQIFLDKDYYGGNVHLKYHIRRDLAIDFVNR
jgi:hypothetical protein